MATEFACAKINLALHVVGQRADGYHLLDSLVVFCGIGDRLQAVPGPVTTLAVAGPFASQVPLDGDNMVLKAAGLYSGGQHFAFTLEKNLPPASGIGGGSADAAAGIRAMLRASAGDDGDIQHLLARLDADLILRLGADVPVCLASLPARMRGAGERLDPLPPLPETHILMVNPRISLPTGEVFASLVAKQNSPLPDSIPDWPDAPALAAWLALQRNDLEHPACTIAPVIRDVLSALTAQPGALIARMSGSGATCFALFATGAEAEASAASIGRTRPDWWLASGPVFTDSPNTAQVIRATT